MIGRQLLDDVDAVRERDDGAAVDLTQRLDEADSRLVNDVHLVRHARAAVQQDDEVERNGAGFEELHLLLDAVLEHSEIRDGEPLDELIVPIGDRDGQRNQVGGAAEDRLLSGRNRGGGLLRVEPRGQREQQGGSDDGTLHESSSASRGASRIPSRSATEGYQRHGGTVGRQRHFTQSMASRGPKLTSNRARNSGQE